MAARPSRWAKPCRNTWPVAEHAFEATSSRLLHRGKVFALRADQVRMPDGGIVTRDVVENYGAVAVVAMNDEDDIALIRQYRRPLGRRLWELPAGLLDIPGEPAQLAAARELKEEAGLAAADWQVLVDLASSPGFSDESIRVYLATGLTDAERPEAHDEEADLTLRWCPIDEAARLALTGEIVNAIAVGGILAAFAVTHGLGRPRPVDAEWIDKPTAFAARQAAR